jgi:GNAT superfamily N-acetyltransferase
VTYRIARKTDAERIALLHADSWKRTYRGIMTDTFLDGDVATDRLRVWQERLRSGRVDQFVFVAEDGGAISGFICVCGNEDPYWGSLIDNLHVAYERKRQGIGAMLMREAGRWLQSNYGGMGVYLWAMAANATARSFYEKLGGTMAETIEKEIPGGGSAESCRYIWLKPAVLSQTI